MTNAIHIDHQATRWPRLVARALVLLWAGWWLFFGLASGIGEELSPGGVLLHAALPGLVFLIVTIIAWRWEAIGGALLLLLGLSVFIAYPMIANSRFSLSTIMFVLATMALPPFVAGLLLLADWRRTRSARLIHEGA